MSKELSKSDVRYWQPRVFKETSKVGGKEYERSDYSVRIRFQDHRERFQLGTPNKYEAARASRDIYQSLLTTGWEKTLQKFKRQSGLAAKCDVTIGEFLEELRALHASKARTIDNYARALRKIVADIVGMPSGGRGGNPENHRVWRGRVDQVKVAFLTAGKIQKWKESFLAIAGNDPVKQRSAKVSVNSFLRRARSLFSPRMLKGLENVVLADPLPFIGVELEKRQSMRYQSAFDVMALISEARDELAIAEPEQFKIFVLAVMAGLRRNEIDKLQWTSFNWHAGTVSVVPTKYFRTKSDNSARDVWVPVEMLELFRGYRAKTVGSFVVESRVKPIMDKAYDHYRCATLFDKLIGWLRSKGVTGGKPLHTLRKEFGSLIAASYGIHAAKQLLGHADIATTAAHYLDAKGKPNVGMGDLLKTPANIVQLTEGQIDSSTAAK